ncbi:hypothetical protein [Amycolatopsis sp. GM8]|uniref:hypothetical protein n=1 Tax=Amycolatopsis sp. GM8 TaxID=2896530 RepID=UPI001F2C3B88|nr:hypothetical protein [Amycolatopsis sp. GM8]
MPAWAAAGCAPASTVEHARPAAVADADVVGGFVAGGFVLVFGDTLVDRGVVVDGEDGGGGGGGGIVLLVDNEVVGGGGAFSSAAARLGASRCNGPPAIQIVNPRRNAAPSAITTGRMRNRDLDLCRPTIVKHHS